MIRITTLVELWLILEMIWDDLILIMTKWQSFQFRFTLEVRPTKYLRQDNMWGHCWRTAAQVVGNRYHDAGSRISTFALHSLKQRFQVCFFEPHQHGSYLLLLFWVGPASGMQWPYFMQRSLIILFGAARLVMQQIQILIFFWCFKWSALNIPPELLNQSASEFEHVKRSAIIISSKSIHDEGEATTKFDGRNRRRLIELSKQWCLLLKNCPVYELLLLLQLRLSSKLKEFLIANHAPLFHALSY